MARGQGDDVLVIRYRVELAGATARTDLGHRAAPGRLFEIDPLHRLEHGRAAYRGHVRERRREARRWRRGLAAGIGAAVAAGDEMRHALRYRAVLDARIRCSMPARRVGFACAKALGDVPAQRVADHLVERSDRVPVGRGRQADTHVRGLRDLVEYLSDAVGIA